MPIAAVPAYLGNDFRHASSGMRFGMYLQLWGVNNRSRELLWETHDINYRIAGKDHEERMFKDENKTSALKQATVLTLQDRAVMAALAERQTITAQGLPHILRLETRSTAPFTTGLGNEHPLENGFAFLNPYGLPYLSGSGVKGVLRQAARELAAGDWGESHGWSLDRSYEIRVGKDPAGLSVIDVLFGLEPEDGSSQHVRGALSFWDVIPQIKGDSLMVEIMTPHQSHYYQQNRQHGSASPHDSGQPNPISFLTVPPGSGFTFHVVCDLVHLGRLAPRLAEGDAWKELLRAAFTHAFSWCGFGAKTAVGYGAMAPGQESEAPPSGESAKELSQEEQQIQGLRNTLADEIQAGQLSPSGRVANDRVNLLKAALEWESVDLRQAAAEAIAETLRQLGWSKKSKVERAAELERLRQPR